MSVEVERVARAVKRARYIRDGSTPDAARIIAQRVFIGADGLADAAAAMRETLLIAAEALRARANDRHYMVQPSPHELREFADWLTARAKETTDDIA